MSSDEKTAKGGADSSLKSVNRSGYGSGYGSTWSNEVPAPVQQSTTTQQVDLKPAHQRVWSVFVSSVVACLPALLGGCTLGFSSAALLDLTELEPRSEFIFNTVQSDIFGVGYNYDQVMCRVYCIPFRRSIAHGSYTRKLIYIYHMTVSLPSL